MKKNKIILFDGVCNLCSSSVQFIIERDKEDQFQFASLQSDFAQKILLKNKLNTSTFDSIVLVENDKIYQKSGAALRIAKELEFPWNLLYVFIIVPYPIRDFVYGIIAKNRYKWFGKKESCWLPTPALRSKFLD